MTKHSSTNPGTPSSDEKSEQAPGVRTEAEVVEDAKKAAEAAANEAPPGATGNPAIDAEIPEEEDDGKLVHYVRVRTATGEDVEDGTVQSVNAGSREHAHLERSAEWKSTTRAAARRADKKRADR